PELEIFADDVICGHGATASAPDKALKFYLMSRGIPEAEAEALLIQAFIGEVVEEISNDGIREALMFAALKWLGARGWPWMRQSAMAPTTSRASERIFLRWLSRSMENRLCIWTMQPRHRNPKPYSIGFRKPIPSNMPTCIAAFITWPTKRLKLTKAHARVSACF